jgi:hypothetical protein
VPAKTKSRKTPFSLDAGQFCSLLYNEGGEEKHYRVKCLEIRSTNCDDEPGDGKQGGGGKEALLHYVKWSSKFDEWVSLESARLGGVELSNRAPGKEVDTLAARSGDEMKLSWTKGGGSGSGSGSFIGGGYPVSASPFSTLSTKRSAALQASTEQSENGVDMGTSSSSSSSSGGEVAFSVATQALGGRGRGKRKHVSLDEDAEQARRQRQRQLRLQKTAAQTQSAAGLTKKGLNPKGKNSSGGGGTGGTASKTKTKGSEAMIHPALTGGVGALFRGAHRGAKGVLAAARKHSRRSPLIPAPKEWDWFYKKYAGLDPLGEQRRQLFNRLGEQVCGVLDQPLF